MHPACRGCQAYDIECWYCWDKGQHVEPESCCDDFKGYEGDDYGADQE